MHDVTIATVATARMAVAAMATLSARVIPADVRHMTVVRGDCRTNS
jgi:hypothetical protein